MASGALIRCEVVMIACSRLLHAGSLLAIALTLGACGSKVVLVSPPFTGVVVDKGTGKPIPQAFVAAKWSGTWTNGHAGNACVKAVAVRTDAAGRFRIEGWTQEHPGLENLLVQVAPYSSGFKETATRPTQGAFPRKALGLIPLGEIEIPTADFRVAMTPTQTGTQSRAEELMSYLRSLDCRDGDSAQIKPLYLAVREEIRGLPADVRDRKPAHAYVSGSLLEFVEAIIDPAWLPK